jgi:phosphate transport system protein
MMRTAYHAQLPTLIERLAELCGVAGEAMHHATDALLDGDPTFAEQVIADHDYVAAMTTRTEQDALILLAMQAPVAAQLRAVVGSIEIAADVERMSLVATHVAKIAGRRNPHHAVPTEVCAHFAQMGDLARQLGHRTQQVLISGSPRTAAHIRRDDDAMDILHRQLMVVMMSRRWYHGAAAAVEVIRLGRFYERFADYAVAIGRRVIYQANGRHLDRPVRI